MVFLLFAVSVVAFALMTASPIDPLKANVGQAALGSMSQEQIAKLEEYWGVGQPPVQRYLAWFRDFVRGDMGVSLLYRQKVTTVIAVKLGNSLFLMIIAWILSGLIGFLLGALAGMKRGKPIDKIIKGYCLVISSTPAFWIAMLLLIIFGVWLKILPIGLSVPIGVEASGVTFLDRVRHAILPAVTLSITGISNIAMHTREKMIDICDSDYVLFAKARGESNWEIFRNHGFRNVLGPAMTLQFASISEIFGGSVLVEQVFSYPGLGQAAVSAATFSAVMAFILGVVSATMGKTADTIVTWFIDLVMGIPHMLLLILVCVACGRGLKGVILGVALTHWTSLARLIRGEVLQLKEQIYIKTARKLGKSNLYIAMKHMVPHLLPQFIVGLVLLFPHAILHESSITFLGFGLSNEQPAIGIILSEAMKYLVTGKWWLALFPGIMLILTVVCFYTTGENLRRLLDPASAHE